MNIVADRYQFRARIIPEFFAALPVLILLISNVQNVLILGFLSLALFFAFFQGHFSSRLGRNLEKKLLEEKKLISNSDFLIARYQKNDQDKYITHLLKTADKSNAEIDFTLKDKAKTERQIDYVIEWLIGHTRDNEKFPAVFDKLCDYGFQRNMLALKHWVLGITALTGLLFVIKSVTIGFPLHFALEFNPDLFETNQGKSGLKVGSVWIFLTACWLCLWIKIISLNALKKANEEYIKTLLKASLSVGTAVTSQEIPS